MRSRDCGGATQLDFDGWTPWFAALGSQSGFDSIADCYGDLAPHIFAVETGLSSDPPMNWRLSMLDRYRLVSELAPIAARVIATRSRHPRAMDPARVSEAFARENVNVEDSQNVSEAIQRAMAANIGGGLICLAGSLFVAAEGREYFDRVPIPLEDSMAASNGRNGTRGVVTGMGVVDQIKVGDRIKSIKVVTP